MGVPLPMKTQSVLSVALLALSLGAVACEDEGAPRGGGGLEGPVGGEGEAVGGEGEAVGGEGEVVGGEGEAVGGEGEVVGGEGEVVGGEGEGEVLGGEGEGEGEGEVVGGEGEGEGEVPEALCAQMQPDPCIAHHACVLELVAEPEGELYRCRPARNVCEREVEPDKCNAVEGCDYSFGDCYCPANVDCDCGDGAPPMCRRGAGVCEDLVQVRGTGGMCEEGGCLQQTDLRGPDYIVFNDETDRTPRYGRLNAIELAPILAMLGDLDPAALDPDGYGECCNGFADGTDWYVTFPGAGDEGVEIRVSDMADAPHALRRLISLLMGQGRALRDSDAEPRRCEEIPI